ncbi:MAG: hypothetical protein FJ298_10090 [Planctomycetes bacterium]|nr:hypothetical protein [Planctomycetota bacterium]
MAKDADPRAEWSSLVTALRASKALAVAYVLRGAERWFRDRAVDALIERSRALEHELCRHDAKDPEFKAQSLIDDLSSSAMFAALRLVIVSEPEALLKKSGGTESALARAIRGFVARRAGTVVLVGDGLRADLAIVKELQSSGGEMRSFRKLYERPPPWARSADPRSTELVEWLLARAREREVKLSTDQAVLLAHAQGNDLAALDDQLAAIAAGGSEVLARLSASAAGSPGDVCDALLAGETQRTVQAVETLFSGGMRREKDGARETDQSALVAILLGYLRPKVRSGLAASELVRAGVSSEDAAAQVGITAFDKTLRAAIASRVPEQWRAMLDDLLAIERRSRRGGEVDASDFVRLALRWSRKAAARAR